MKKAKPTEVKYSDQGHGGRTWQSWDWALTLDPKLCSEPPSYTAPRGLRRVREIPTLHCSMLHLLMDPAWQAVLVSVHPLIPRVCSVHKHTRPCAKCWAFRDEHDTESGNAQPDEEGDTCVCITTFARGMGKAYLFECL